MLSELVWTVGSAVASALLVLGLSGVIGTLGFCWLLRGSNRVAALERARRVGLWSASLVLVAAGIRTWLQCAALADTPSAWTSMLSAVLFESQLGVAMRVQAAAAALAVAGFVGCRRNSRLGATVVALAALGLCLSPGLGGHPAAQEQRLLALLISFAHVSGVGAWLGTLAVLTLCARRLSDEDVARAVRRFHRLATIGLTAVVLSGAVKLWEIAPDVTSLSKSSWGIALTVKMAAFFVIAAMGYRHWRTTDVALASGRRRNTLRSFTLELLFALIVLGATSLLVNSSPPEQDAVATAVH